MHVGPSGLGLNEHPLPPGLASRGNRDASRDARLRRKGTGSDEGTSGAGKPEVRFGPSGLGLNGHVFFIRPCTHECFRPPRAGGVRLRAPLKSREKQGRRSAGARLGLGPMGQRALRAVRLPRRMRRFGWRCVEAVGLARHLDCLGPQGRESKGCPFRARPDGQTCASGLPKVRVRTALKKPRAARGVGPRRWER